jgi:anti-anti-sigma factor
VTALARIAVEQAGAVTVAAVDGEIDASNAADIGHRLRLLVDNRARALIVDLAATRYIDSAGIKLLFELGAALRERQQRSTSSSARPARSRGWSSSPA